MDDKGNNPPAGPQVEVQDIDSSSTARTLEAVTIHKIASHEAAQFTSTTASVSSRSTAASNDREDYSTPATSGHTSPEATVNGNGRVPRKRTRLSYEETAQYDSTSHDADLAKALQEKEYSRVDNPSKRRRIVDDSERDDDEVFYHVHDAMSLDGDQDVNLKEVDEDAEEEDAEEEEGESLSPAARRHALAKARSGKKAASQRPSRNSTGRQRPTLVKGESVSDLSDLATLSVDDAISEQDFAASDSADDDDFEAAPSSLVNRPSKGKGRKRSTTLPASAVELGQTDVEHEQDMLSVLAGKKRRRGHEYLNSLTHKEMVEYRRAGGRREKERWKLERAHPIIKTMWEDLKKIPVIKPVQAPQPESINRRLKSFQLEGLDWMIRQEKSHYKGGLLGDEMGMGKTIQAVSLIMSDYPAKSPSLVLVPPVALMQWSNEIKEYTNGKLNVLVYHGQNSKTKGLKVKDLKKYDVIMISYNSLESIYRKQVKGWTRGEDMVKEVSPIHAIKYHRIILDEAHSIKSRTTGVAKACFALKATYKWCLSGTPVQNRIGEFFSLLRFLQVRPFADYFCKRCPCSTLHWEVDSDYRCTSCKHSSIEHVSVFNQELLNPLTQSEDLADRHAAMEKLHMVTARIMLRRMKKDYVDSLELPPKEVIVHNEFFGEIERDFSSSIMQNTIRTFDTYVSRGVMLNNYANIFGLIMQMRQVANHPDLLLKKHAHEGQNVLVCHICDEAAEDAIRSKCKHEFCRSCVKTFVQSCEESGGDADCPRCHIPLTIDFDQPEIIQDEDAVQKTSIINRIRMENWTSSTKIEMLVYDLWKLRSSKQTCKSIIFSQFTSMLQLVEWRLRRAGFNTVMLDGTMTPVQRQRSIDHFMTTPECEIFLVSLKAGGVALNLTEASRVFIIDPWWNPAAEWQSADRCHRIGQTRPCVITRLVIEDSVESRIVMLQEKKANMISSTINNDKVAMEKLTPEDMQFLFRGT